MKIIIRKQRKLGGWRLWVVNDLGVAVQDWRLDTVEDAWALCRVIVDNDGQWWNVGLLVGVGRP